LDQAIVDALQTKQIVELQPMTPHDRRHRRAGGA
jgi:hypothetical protein